MSPSRRWFQYSLRSFLVVLTALAVWLGVIVNRARDQREAAEAIGALGGSVSYDYQLSPNLQLQFNPDGTFTLNESKAGPAWLQRLIGDDYFQNVERVCVPERKVLESIPHLKMLRHLKNLDVTEGLSSEMEHRLRSTLPHCEITAWKLDGERTNVIEHPIPLEAIPEGLIRMR